MNGAVTYDHEGVDRLSQGYFYTDVCRSDPTRFHVWHPVLHTLGKGTYLGMILQLPESKNFTALEGDPLMMVDSNPRSTFRGTGTEDYFNGGNYFLWGPFSQPFQGCISWANSMYRFHCLDAMCFDRSFDFDFQHGFNADVEIPYRTTAFYYKQWTPFWTSRDTVMTGDLFAISGSGYASGEEIRFRLDSDLIGGVVADKNGNFIWKISTPNYWTPGCHILSANDVHRPEAICVLDKPAIRPICDTLPIRLEVGDTLAFTAYGFRPGEPLLFSLDSIPLSPKRSVTVRNDGRLYNYIQIPVIKEGTYHLRIIGDHNDTAIFSDLIAVSQTRNYEFERLHCQHSDSVTAAYQNLSYCYWASWSEQAVEICSPKRLGDTISFSFFVPEKDSFNIFAFATIGTNFGNYRYSLDGIQKGLFIGYKNLTGNDRIPSDTLKLGIATLDAGFHRITFTYLGHNASSKDSLLGADHFVIVPFRTNSEAHGAHLSQPLNIILYPNPATSGYITIKLLDYDVAPGGASIITVSDLLGRNVISHEVSSSTFKNPYTLMLGDLLSGRYSIHIRSNSSVGERDITAPFVVSK
jgi:hypothetical protein